MMQRLLIICALVLSLLPVAALAVEPDEILPDPKQEERAREISASLRCLVCQNQSIDDSNAELAKDLRVLVRERITAGDTNEEVLDYLVARYGEFVLLQPRFGVHTLILWLTPPIVLIIGLIALFFAYRRRHSGAALAKTAPAELSDAEKKALQDIMTDG